MNSTAPRWLPFKGMNINGHSKCSYRAWLRSSLRWISSVNFGIHPCSAVPLCAIIFAVKDRTRAITCARTSIDSHVRNGYTASALVNIVPSLDCTQRVHSIRRTSTISNINHFQSLTAITGLAIKIHPDVLTRNEFNSTTGGFPSKV